MTVFFIFIAQQCLGVSEQKSQACSQVPPNKNTDNKFGVNDNICIVTIISEPFVPPPPLKYYLFVDHVLINIITVHIYGNISYSDWQWHFTGGGHLLINNDVPCFL